MSASVVCGGLGSRQAGARGEGRTLNLRLRRPTLYPIELLALAEMTLGQSAPGGNLFSATLQNQRKGAKVQRREQRLNELNKLHELHEEAAISLFLASLPLGAFALPALLRFSTWARWGRFRRTRR